jgi:diguanylate cyclase (GGDEF)-like protein
MTIGTGRTYLRLRLSAIGILVLHLGIRLIFPTPNPIMDILVFNAVAFIAATVAFAAPLFNDRLATLSLGWALALWGAGSTVSTWSSFYPEHHLLFLTNNFPDLAYATFYPLVLFALIRALTSKRGLSALELLDVIIITFGMSSLLASLLLKTAMKYFVGGRATVFLSIIYPVGDMVLLGIALVIVILQARAMRSLLFLLGIGIFTGTDLFFIWKSATTGYSFAALTDDGWLIGLVIMAEALWHPGSETELSDRITSIAATIALVGGGSILTMAALNRNYLPAFALLPAIITIALAFIRMSIALTSAREAQSERVLARHDELTGLANRRSFIAELEELVPNEGTVLLMDLDGFKSVNDKLGHLGGDELLRQIAIRFSRVIPHDALLARLGGDEFGVVIHGPPRIGLEVAHALQSTLGYPFLVEGLEIGMGVSIGRVINDGNPDLLRRADFAMYQSKRAGGGITLWEP